MTTRVMFECSRCGGGMLLSEEMVADLSEASGPVTVAHDVCPQERAPQRTFRVRIQVVEVMEDGEELLAQAAAEQVGSSFSKVAEAITETISERWGHVVKHASLADAGPSEASEG